MKYKKLIFLSFVFLTLFVFSSSVRADETLSPSYSSIIGVYHWGSFVNPLGSVLGGVDFAAEKGFKIVRLALSPRSSEDYGVSSSCDSGKSLKQLALLNGFPQAFANPSINTFILTTYDSITWSDCITKKYLNPSFYTTANTAAVTQEYYDLALYLYQTYKNTGKKFILSNWEGDNDLYCGSAYAYATNASSRNDCNSKYSIDYNGNASVDDSIAGMKLWLTARTAGINNARIAAASEGITGVTVSSAGEFNIVKVLHDNGYKSMMYDVLPGLNLDYVSYSSYESINLPDPAAVLLADIQTIRSKLGNNIIVGEFGYSPTDFKENAPNFLKEVAQAISLSGVPYGIIWQLFDQPGSNFGLFTTTKADTSMFKVLSVNTPDPSISTLPLTPPPIPASGNTGTLKVSSTDKAAVMELQKSLGFTGADVDGIFGPKTLAAVKAYQTANGLTVDGVVGPATKAKMLTNPPVSTPTVPPPIFTPAISPAVIPPVIISTPPACGATGSCTKNLPITLCTGPIYSDGSASQACATSAETQGKARGYVISCTSQKVGLLYPEPNTGLMYYYNATCTVNGTGGHGAQLLAGYAGYGGYDHYTGSPGLVNGRALDWSGNDPGWDTLETELKSFEASDRCGGTNYGVNLATGQYYCLSSSATPSQTTTPQPTTSTGTSATNGNTSSTSSSTSTPTGSIYTDNSTQTIKDEVAKQLSGYPKTFQDWYKSTPPKATTPAPVSNPPATTPPPLACSLTATCNLNSPVVVVSGVLSPFRYLKVETTENGWVSWREIEIYDDNGQKITPVSATASDTYDQNSRPWSTNTPAVASNVYDGNYEKAWNSGETNPTCKGNWTSACPPSLRSAWIKVDLGSVKNVSKIRLMKNGENSSHSTKISISGDNNIYTNIATFNAPALDRQWLEFPSQYITPPEINLTVNGSSSTTVTPGHGVYYKWDIKNADSVTVSYTKKLVKAPTIPLAPYAAAVYCTYQKDGILPSIPVPFSSQKLVPLSGDTVYYFQPHDTFTDCSKGYQFDVTFKAIQSVSGKSTTKTVSIIVGEDNPAPLSGVMDIFSGYLAPSNAMEAYGNKPQTILHSGESASAPVVGYKVGCLDIYHPVRDTSVPAITLGNVPSGVTATLDPVVLDPLAEGGNVCDYTYYRTKLNVSVGSTAQLGFTFLKVFINGRYGEFGLNIK